MCHNIIELHKKIEKQITHILNSTNELKEKQIKGESHLLEPIDAMEFITKTFDTYKQISTRGKLPLWSCGKQKQCSGRNYLLLHGSPKKKQENTDNL